MKFCSLEPWCIRISLWNTHLLTFHSQMCINSKIEDKFHVHSASKVIGRPSRALFKNVFIKFCSCFLCLPFIIDTLLYMLHEDEAKFKRMTNLNRYY